MNNDVNHDLSRLLLEREFEKSRADLERHKAELSQAIAQAKVDIGLIAVQRMDSAFRFFKTCVTIAIAALLSLGGLGYFSAQSTVKHVVDTKINDWLSFERKDSIIRQTLEKTRMRVVLDSLVVKMARAKVDGQHRLSFTLSEPERARLVAYMRDPATDLSDFRDSVRVLSAAFGPFATYYSFDDMEQMLKDVFADEGFQDEKRGLLLMYLKGYPGMFRYASYILKQENSSLGWRIGAFDIVRQYQQTQAIQYAESHLLKETDASFQFAMAKALLINESSSTLEAWLSLQLKSDDGILNWATFAGMVAPSKGFSIDSARGRREELRSARYLFKAISLGANLNVCDELSAALPSLCFEKATARHFVMAPRNIFQNDAILAEMVRLAAIEKIPESEFVAALTASSKMNAVFGLRVDLGSATIATMKHGQIDVRNVQGTVLLTPVSVHGREGVYASFRSADGHWVHDLVTGYAGLYSATLHFAFDEEVLNRMEMNEFNKDDW